MIYLNTTDGTTLRIEPYDGTAVLRISIAPAGHPSAGVNLPIATLVEMARAVFGAAGYKFINAEPVEEAPRIDHAADSAARTKAFAEASNEAYRRSAEQRSRRKA